MLIRTNMVYDCLIGLPFNVKYIEILIRWDSFHLVAYAVKNNNKEFDDNLIVLEK